MSESFTPGVSLGGALNTGMPWKTIILGVCGTVAVAATVGGFQCGGKFHSQLQKAALKEKKPAGGEFGDLAALMQQANAANGSRSRPQAPSEPQQSDAYSRQLMQQLIQNLSNQAASLQAEGKFEEAGEAYLQCTNFSENLGPHQMVFQSRAIQCFVEASRFDLAYNTLLATGPPNSEAEALERELQLATFLIRAGDSRGLEHLQAAEDMTSQTPEGEAKRAEINKFRGEHYVKTGHLSKAEEALRAAISFYLEKQKADQLTEVSKECLRCYLELQRMYICQGKTTIAMEIDEEIQTHTAANYDDISYYWHLTHCAYIFVEQGYDGLAEKCWKRVLETYEPAYKEIVTKKKQSRSTFENRVLSIVTNSKNEMSVMFYNQGRRGLYQEIFDELSAGQYQLQTTSKYFDSARFNIRLAGESEPYVSFQFFLTLKVRNHDLLHDITGITFKVLFEGEVVDETTHDFQYGANIISLESTPQNSIREGLYSLIAELSLDRGFGNEESYSHIQNLASTKAIPPNTTIQELSARV